MGGKFNSIITSLLRYVEFESAQFAAGAKQFVHKNNLAIHGKSLKPFFKRAATTPPAKDEHRKR